MEKGKKIAKKVEIVLVALLLLPILGVLMIIPFVNILVFGKVFNYL